MRQRLWGFLLLAACSPQSSMGAKPSAEPTPTSSAEASATPLSSAAPTASIAPTASAASSSASAPMGPPGVMMLDDDLLKRVSKKGEIYVVTLKKQAAHKCTMTVVAGVVGPRKGDFEITCSMDLKPGDYVIAIETTGPSGKQITSAASVAPGQSEAAARAHADRIKTLK